MIRQRIRTRIHHSLTYLIVTLIAMQSFVAVADEHRTHQAGDQHVEVLHDVSLGISDRVDLTQDVGSSVQSDDCQHCCHCHASYAVLAGDKFFVFSSGDTAHWKQAVVYYSTILSPAFRPPIV